MIADGVLNTGGAAGTGTEGVCAVSTVQAVPKVRRKKAAIKRRITIAFVKRFL
jgi:hypothetical protein